MSNRIIAANDNVLTGLCLRRKKNDAQKTKVIIAALTVGALGGTINVLSPSLDTLSTSALMKKGSGRSAVEQPYPENQMPPPAVKRETAELKSLFI